MLEGRSPSSKVRSALWERRSWSRRGNEATNVRTGWAIALLLATVPAAAMETDQFLVWEESLEDSGPAINAFVEQRMETVLAELRAEGRSDLACEELPPILFRDIHFNLLSSRIRTFLSTSPAVDRYPRLDLGYRGYLQASIFRRPAFPYLMPMARTVRFGEVTLGIDKFGHLFAFGRRYYVRVQAKVRQGTPRREALTEAILWGLRLEDSLVGRMTDGVFSHADLEANYQGYRLAVDLCSASPPHLEHAADGWRLARPVDLAAYVTPLLDETFNNNHYADFRWKRVEPVLRREYCPEWRSPEVQARMRRYAWVAHPSFSTEVVASWFAEHGGNPQPRYALGRLCEEKEEVREEPRPSVARTAGSRAEKGETGRHERPR